VHLGLAGAGVSRANPPEKKAADREASDFALTRAQRRRVALKRDHEGEHLAPYEVRREQAEAAGKEHKSIGDRIVEQTWAFFSRRWRFR
jgi:hypothetical protein